MLTSSLEDYLEAIYVIRKNKPVIRVKEIAQFLGVTMPSVNTAIKELSRQNLIEHERYGYIDLTEAGKLKGQKIYDAHKIIKRFLHDILGVDETHAEQDACKIEHVLSDETLQKIMLYATKFKHKGGDRDA